MSGGSYNYIYYKLEEECSGAMYDAEMNELITDLCKVLHDVEWWTDGDIGEEEYRETLVYIDKQLAIVRHELYTLIGEKADAEKSEEVQDDKP